MQEIGIITWTFACAAGTDVRNGDQARFDDHALEITAVPVTARPAPGLITGGSA